MAILDQDGKVLPGAAEVLEKENDVHIAKIGWLSRKDTGKAYGSMVVYVTKGSEAARLLQDQYFYVAGESTYTGIFERRYGSQPCYRSCFTGCIIHFEIFDSPRAGDRNDIVPAGHQPSHRHLRYSVSLPGRHRLELVDQRHDTGKVFFREAGHEREEWDISNFTVGFVAPG